MLSTFITTSRPLGHKKHSFPNIPDTKLLYLTYNLVDISLRLQGDFCLVSVKRNADCQQQWI